MNPIFVIASVVLKEMVRRKDVYVLFFLTGLICIGAASINFFDEAETSGYLKEICLFLIWISTLVMAVTSAARQLPQERELRTIYPLLAKPVSRADVILGKFAGCWAACGITVLVFYGFYALLSMGKAGSLDPVVTFQAAWMHWMALGVITSMALLGSVVFAAPSSNATICFTALGTIFVLGRHLGKLAADMAEPTGTILSWLYFIMPHLEWYDLRVLLVQSQAPVEWLPWLLATPYALAYTAVFLFTTWRVFKKMSLD